MKVPEFRRRITAALAHYFHLLPTQIFPGNKGAFGRVGTHQHWLSLGYIPTCSSLLAASLVGMRNITPTVLFNDVEVVVAVGGKARESQGKSTWSSDKRSQICLSFVPCSAPHFGSMLMP